MNKPAHQNSPEMTEACEDCLRELEAILATRSLVARFRPVANLAKGGIFGHVASVHVALDYLPWNFDRLLGLACRNGKLTSLVEASFAAAVNGFVDNQGLGQLFVAPPRGCAEHIGKEIAGLLARALNVAGLKAERVIVIHPGVMGTDHPAAANAHAAAQALRELGVALAYDSFNCAHSKELLGSTLEPNFVLAENELFADLGVNLAHFKRYVESLRAGAGHDRRIVGMGANSLAAVKILQEAGVDLAVGDFIGKSFALPSRTLPVAAHKAIAEAGIEGNGVSKPSTSYVLEKMLIRTPPVNHDTLTGEVFALFEREPDQRAVAVVRDGFPIGLISRYEMLDNMARPFRHELYSRKHCTRFMDREPLIVNVQTPLLELSELLANAHPRHLISGFIITDGATYLGMGSVQDLVREITSMQMEAAKYANPLTQLPGNVPINEYIDHLLATREHAAICYCDLDNFKPFNDVYGYARGDDVIRLTARILGEICDPELDFLGHIGGDDFVLVFRSHDWQVRCELALKKFGDEILGFFSRDDIERGGYLSENRKGQIEFHGLTTLSIGAMEVTPGRFSSHLAVAVVTAEVKKKAKAIKGNSFYCNRRTYEDDGQNSDTATVHASALPDCA